MYVVVRQPHRRKTFPFVLFEHLISSICGQVCAGRALVECPLARICRPDHADRHGELVASVLAGLEKFRDQNGVIARLAHNTDRWWVQQERA